MSIQSEYIEKLMTEYVLWWQLNGNKNPSCIVLDEKQAKILDKAKIKHPDSKFVNGHIKEFKGIPIKIISHPEREIIYNEVHRD